MRIDYFYKKKSDTEISDINTRLVPEAGVEPAWVIRPKDFKSFASTISPLGHEGWSPVRDLNSRPLD